VFYSLRRHPPRSAVLNLELCLPCTQFSRDLIFSIIIDSIILYTRVDATRVTRMIPRVEIIFSFLFSFFLAYLLRSYNYIRRYTYFTRAGWYYFELFLITCVICNMIINFIVTIPKYRGTMDTNYFLLFRLPRGVFLVGLCFSCCCRTPRFPAAFKLGVFSSSRYQRENWVSLNGFW